MESLEILGKLIYNAAVAPKEEKYRKIKLSNPKIDEKLGQVGHQLTDDRLQKSLHLVQ